MLETSKGAFEFGIYRMGWFLELRREVHDKPEILEKWSTFRSANTPWVAAYDEHPIVRDADAANSAPGGTCILPLSLYADAFAIPPAKAPLPRTHTHTLLSV